MLTFLWSFDGAACCQKARKLQFSIAEEVSIQKKNGNFNNVRICYGKIPQVLADFDGVLAVMCPRNNGGHVKPQAGTSNYTLTIEIPRSDHDRRNPNGGITTLVKIESGMTQMLQQ
jgi:hypothetical protein